MQVASGGVHGGELIQQELRKPDREGKLMPSLAGDAALRVCAAAADRTSKRRFPAAAPLRAVSSSRRYSAAALRADSATPRRADSAAQVCANEASPPRRVDGILQTTSNQQ